MLVLNAEWRPTYKMIFAKNRYTWPLLCQKKGSSKTKYTSHARSPAIGQRHIVPVFGLKRPGTPVFVYFVQLSIVFGEFWANQRPYISDQKRIVRRLIIVMDWYTATLTRSIPILHVYTWYTYRLLLLPEMVWITADQSQIHLDFSPVRMLTMWLLCTVLRTEVVLCIAV